MIGRLCGTVVRKYDQSVLMDVNGVGYEVDVPMTTLVDLGDSGAACMLYTHLVVREDAQLLYGFMQESERDVFRELIKVSGVGARTALAMLSTFDANSLAGVILQQDITRLAKVPGIGKKSAERIIVALKDRLDQWGGGHYRTVATASSTSESHTDDAVSALIALGYKPNVASKAVQEVAEQADTSEAMIRLALKRVVALT